MNAIAIELLQTVTGGAPQAAGALDPYVARASAKTAAQVNQCIGFSQHHYTAKRAWLRALDEHGKDSPEANDAWKGYQDAGTALLDCENRSS